LARSSRHSRHKSSISAENVGEEVHLVFVDEDDDFAWVFMSYVARVQIVNPWNTFSEKAQNSANQTIENTRIYIK